MEYEHISLMEPTFPERDNRPLEDLAVTLVEKAHQFASVIKPAVAIELGYLVRSMNCYYSNLIEGHDTHPRDIERALNTDYSNDPIKRNLQVEAKAHIQLQQKIDLEPLTPDVTSPQFIRWLHYEFCSQLPDELLWSTNPDTQKTIKVIPGEYRQNAVIVGQHIPPRVDSIPRFMQRFDEVYNPSKLPRVKQIIAIAASHHRLLWIHPFLDGNGRVTRLYSHAYLKQIGLGSSLWSISRGLARKNKQYKVSLMNADSPRRGDLDGRGSLSAAALIAFCEFFISTCIDQIEFMSVLVDPKGLLNRIEKYTQNEISEGRLHKGSYNLLREAFLIGEFDRGKAAAITNYKERQARTVLNSLIKAGLLKADSPRSPVRLAFPISVIENWFPRLYPENIRIDNSNYQE